MARITGVRLHNICQHADVSFAVNTGLTALVGRNGCGKTSCLRGIVYALTGLVDGLWGTQQTLQKDGTADVGYAEVSFVHDGQRYAVRRYATSSVKFPDIVTKDSEVVAKRRQAVNTFMENVFGMSCQLMFIVCWGRQGELAQLLTATPAVISAFLAQVFDTRFVDKVRDKIKVQLDRVPIVQDCSEQLTADKAALESLPDEDALKAQLEEHKEALSKAQAALAKAQVALSTGMRRSDYDLAMRTAEMAVATCKARLGAMPMPTVTIEELIPQDKLKTLIDSTRAKINDENAAMSAATAEEATAKQMLHTVDASIVRIEGEIEAFNKVFGSGGGQCVLCGSTVKDRLAYVNNAHRLSDTLGRHTNGDDALEQLRTRRTALEERLSKAAADIELHRIALGKAQEVVNALEVMQKAAEYYELEANLKDKQRQIADLKTRVVTDGDSEALYAEAQRNLQQCSQDVERATAMLSSTISRRDMLTSAIATGEKMQRQREINSQVRTALSTLRDILSQSRAQARYMQNRIAMLNADLARYVSYTEMPFTLRLDPDTRMFMYRTPDGYDHPTAHLSGAQKSMASVALQMALFATMRPNMNLYLIDEPTEALDNENKVIMADMFTRLSKMLPAVDGTMIIITRDELLEQRCDNRITLTGDLQ